MLKLTNKGTKKGFTLIELLVVIAIIAILAVVVVLTLNPAEMMRRARDSNRASDLGMIKTAISLYLSDVSSTSMGTAGTCYIAYSGTAAPTAVYEYATTTATNQEATVAPSSFSIAAGTATCVNWFNSNTTAGAATTSNSRSVTNGWIPINLSLISSGAPIAQWPVDPAYSVGANSIGNTNAGHFYSYIPGSNNSYKIAAKMESVIYSYGGSGDLESTDGGVDPYMYEQGTNMSL